MEFIGRGYDSQVFQVWEFCSKTYESEWRILDEVTLREYHRIQTWIADIVNPMELQHTIQDGYPYNWYKASLQVLPLPQDSISKRIDGICVSYLPLVEWWSETYDQSVHDIIRNSWLDTVMQKAILMSFAPMNMRVKTVWKYRDKTISITVTDLWARIWSYVSKFHQLAGTWRLDYKDSSLSN